MAKKEETKKYVVIKKHTLGHKKGAVISLTDKKAQALVGKVRLQSEELESDGLAEEVGQIQEANNELTAENTQLKAEIKKLTAENTQLKKAAK